jgi:DNA-directed RNA polymerase subunit RPC12/RpoP
MEIAELKSHFKKCEQCKKSMLILGYTADICDECRELLNNTQKVEHSRMIRCPNCQFKISMYDLEDIFTEDEHTVTCPSCDYDFEIVTRLEYNFESPALIK